MYDYGGVCLDKLCSISNRNYGHRPLTEMFSSPLRVKLTINLGDRKSDLVTFFCLRSLFGIPYTCAFIHTSFQKNRFKVVPV